MKGKSKKKITLSLARILMALVVISSWAVLGVALALKSTQIGMSGSISFTATDVYATINGKIEGVTADEEDTCFNSETGVYTLNTINIDSESSEGMWGDIYDQQVLWNNLDLGFTDDNLITITITITNNATDRSLFVKIGDTFSNSERTSNITTQRYKGDTDITTEGASSFDEYGVIELGKKGDEAKANSVDIKFTLSVTDRNASASSRFDIDIDLSSTMPE